MKCHKTIISTRILKDIWLSQSFNPSVVFQVEWKGKSFHFRFIFTGTKGDWPFLRSAYSLECGFTSAQKCHRCEVRDLWLYVLYMCFSTRWNHFFCGSSLNEHPFPLPSPVSSKEWWDVKRHLKTLPGDSTNTRAFKVGERSPLRELSLGDATKYIRIDPAHTWAIDGVGKDFLASCIIILVRANHFGSGSTPHSLQNAYASFLAYCNAYKKTTSITEFGFSTFKLPQNSFLGFVNIFCFHPTGRNPLQKLYVTFSPIRSWHFLPTKRLNGFPHGLGKGHDAAAVGAWLAQEVERICYESCDFW